MVGLYIYTVVGGSSESDEDTPSDSSDFGDQSPGEWLDENMPSWGSHLEDIPRPALEIEAADLVHEVLDAEAADGCDEAPLLTEPERFSFQLSKACKTTIITSYSEDDDYRDAIFDVSACTQGLEDASSLLKITYREGDEVVVNEDDEDEEDEDLNEDLKEQTWPPDDMAYDPNEASITVLQQKGEIIFEYFGDDPCLITLE